ncbi:hypothetical protein Hanom_Chr12g01170211 [Helianthus anomalus]
MYSLKSTIYVYVYCQILNYTHMYILDFKLYICHIAEPDDTCTTNQLFECLPLIECLTTWSLVYRVIFIHIINNNYTNERKVFNFCFFFLNICFGIWFKWLVLDSVPQELPTNLIHLKYFCFQELDLGDSYVLAFLLLLIKYSPNLEKIKLEIDDSNCKEDSVVVWEKYSNVWLEHLHELEIRWFENSKPEMDVVKFILARSPKLRKVSIISVVEKKQKSKILETLLQAPRVSPVVITTVT